MLSGKLKLTLHNHRGWFIIPTEQLQECAAEVNCSHADLPKSANPKNRIAAILGGGRSGTTWLGSIINSHPKIAYRFEPFHRAKHVPSLRRVAELMKSGRVEECHLPEMYEALIRANAMTEKPPFFHKDDLPKFGQLWLWRLSRAVPICDHLFVARFTPRDGRMLIFKEVTFEKHMRRLLLNTSIPLVYLVRHPCATVASLVKGQHEGKMSTGRLGVVESLANKHDHELLNRLNVSIDDLDDVQKNALLWRIDVENAINAIQSTGRGLLLTYEQLCDDAHRYTEMICREFDLDFHPQMRTYLDSLYESPHPAAGGEGGEGTGGARDVRDTYFTVYRNPKDQKNRWKSSFSAENIHKVEAIIKDSPAYEVCASLGNW